VATSGKFLFENLTSFEKFLSSGEEEDRLGGGKEDRLGGVI